MGQDRVLPNAGRFGPNVLFARAHAIALLIFLMSGGAVLASDAKPAGAQPGYSTMLDGMSFVGRLGFKEKPAHVDESVDFANGKFTSSECVKCGYDPSDYWAWREGDTIKFMTVGHCKFHDATLVWRGTVHPDGAMKMTSKWTRKRWYRTIVKEFWFTGESKTPLQISKTD